MSSCAVGFEDTVQRYPTTSISDVWNESATSAGGGSSSITIENYPVLYPTAAVIKLYTNSNGVGSGRTATAKITSIDCASSEYVSYTLKDYNILAGWPSYNYNQVKYINESGAVIFTLPIDSTLGRHELIKAGGFVQLYVDGVYKTQAAITTDYGSINIQFKSYSQSFWTGSSWAQGAANMMIDDISTSSVVGINEEWTEAATYIDTSYGIRSMSSYPESLFEMKIYKISDNSLVNSTTLTDQSGFVRWNRSEILGTNYGMFKASIERDDVELANALFSHEYSQTGAYTPTIITVYSSTNATVQDEDSTGGSTNQNGYRYLSPHDNGDKIYPISISLNNSNSVDVIVSANPEYVNSSPLTISGLSDAKSYHVFIDGEFITQITGVSSYYYNIPSFSTHTFSLIDSVNIPVIEIGSSGGATSSGLITVGEITLTKDLVDVLTVEQIEDMDVSQEVKDQLIKLKSINFDWWKLLMLLGFVGFASEGGRKKGNISIAIISLIACIVSAFKLGYF